ncbi:pilus assembly protein [Albimonas sp. CAU 1670]|uniref:pilus assembly protein n=1 Tax=Albimonas sp. CAU 1670 TaxID=3032599 RepID=UPI0023DAF59C|nr:pilus assembly protein [Albimonas sp. CAU 1670]MDF2234420.1 pilus assembly protein [Albimonas sp. CAU 1670]
MNIFAKARRAISDESGAVTVDWVVLTAAVVILSIGAITTLSGGVDGLISSISSELGEGAGVVSTQTWE